MIKFFLIFIVIFSNFVEAQEIERIFEFVLRDSIEKYKEKIVLDDKKIIQ